METINEAVEKLNCIAELEELYNNKETVDVLTESYEEKNVSAKFDTVDAMFAALNEELANA